MLEHPNEIREFHSPLKGHYYHAATPWYGSTSDEVNTL